MLSKADAAQEMYRLLNRLTENMPKQDYVDLCDELSDHFESCADAARQELEEVEDE